MKNAIHHARVSLSLVVGLCYFSGDLAAQVQFADSVVEREVSIALGAHPPITQEQLSGLTALCIEGVEQVDLTGVGKAVNLRVLRVYDCRVSGLSGLSELVNLREVTLRRCGISDLSFLSRSTRLAHLLVPGNAIADIHVLGRFSNLEWVDLRDNKVADVESLRLLRNLRGVDLRGNPVGSGRIDLLKQQVGTSVKLEAGPSSPMSDAVLAAEAKVSHFLVNARILYPPEIDPQLPRLPDAVLAALTQLPREITSQHVGDIASVLMMYGMDTALNYPPSRLIDGREALPGYFLTIAFPDRVGRASIASLAMAEKLCERREEFGPSGLMDIQVERMPETKRLLDEKYKLPPS